MGGGGDPKSDAAMYFLAFLIKEDSRNYTSDILNNFCLISENVKGDFKVEKFSVLDMVIHIHIV